MCLSLHICAQGCIVCTLFSRKLKIIILAHLDTLAVFISRLKPSTLWDVKIEKVFSSLVLTLSAHLGGGWHFYWNQFILSPHLPQAVGQLDQPRWARGGQGSINLEHRPQEECHCWYQEDCHCDWPHHLLLLCTAANPNQVANILFHCSIVQLYPSILM